MMADLIGCLLGLFVVFGLPSLLSNSNKNQKFGDGKNRYYFKDYVNDKADKYNKQEGGW